MTFKEGLLIGGGALLVYYLLLSPSQRKALETWANTHHFEYALGIGGLGVLKNDTTVLGIATVFGIHDWKDKDIAIQKRLYGCLW